MTKPRYQKGCAAGSQVCGRASASNPEINAWNVNLNNGNSNRNNQNNKGLLLAVRGPVSAPGECQGAATFRALYEAWGRARRQKWSRDQLVFESQLLDNLLGLERRINAGTWSPGPTTRFIATRPKSREIHAPDFGDRVVHHWLVPQLEAIFEPRFIHDSYANRIGKGTHAAVERLEAFARQVDSGQGGGWYLQLDVKNFFYSIRRATLYAQLKRGMVRAGLSIEAQRVTHALLRQAPLRAGVRDCSAAADSARVPAHKRLENAPPGRGLPIGNLSSQFFANVYLDALDQFVKHELKAKRYLRYVDDFVLVHESREQLEAWLPAIQTFLRDRLGLELKAEIKLRPLTAGIDFLGYVARPTHTLVRPRVVRHLREKLHAWSTRHVRQGGTVSHAKPEEYRHLQAVVASYRGHFSHASARRLEHSLARQFPWLAGAAIPRRFHPDLEGQRVTLPLLRNTGAAFSSVMVQ